METKNIEAKQQKPCFVIGICTEKGGTGKSATSLCLASCLQALGYNTLLLDCDSSGGASVACIRDLDSTNNTLYDVFNGNCSVDEAIIRMPNDGFSIIPTIKDNSMDEPDDPDSFVLKDRKNLSVLFDRIAYGSHSKMQGMHMNRLIRNIQAGHPEYDFILIDTPPVACPIVDNVLNVSGIQLLIPAQPNSHSISGINGIISSLMKQSASHPDTFNAYVDGVVFTMYSNKWKDRQYFSNELVKMLSATDYYLYNTKFRLSSVIEKSMNSQTPITEYGSQGCGLADSMNFTLEFLRRRGLEPRKEFDKVKQLEDGRWFYGDPVLDNSNTEPADHETKYYYFFTVVGDKAICEKRRFTSTKLTDDDFVNKLNSTIFLSQDAMETVIHTQGLMVASKEEIPNLRRKLRRQKAKEMGDAQEEEDFSGSEDDVSEFAVNE